MAVTDFTYVGQNYTDLASIPQPIIDTYLKVRSLEQTIPAWGCDRGSAPRGTLISIGKYQAKLYRLIKEANLNLSATLFLLSNANI